MYNCTKYAHGWGERNLKRMRFERPTDHYDASVVAIDEQICALIKQRKDISKNNPGYPPFELIAKWAQRFDLYEDFLKSVFSNLRNEEIHRPRVEPATFTKHLPVLKSVAIGEDIYTVTFIQQYDNASVVNLHIDSVPREHDAEYPSPHRHRHFKLSIGEGYDCHGNGGGGGNDHMTYRFVVAPSLPDVLSGLQLIFTELKSPFGEPTGFCVEVKLD